MVPVIRYEPCLLAEVVHPLLGSALRTRYHIESEVLYERHPPERRAEAFAALEARMFKTLPQYDIFEEALRDAGPLPGLREVQVCRAVGDDEGADLNPSGDMAIVRVRPRRVGGDARALRAFLLHEFTHLVDMLDPGFGYRCEDPAPREVRAFANLVRDRRDEVFGYVSLNSHVLDSVEHLEVVRRFIPRVSHHRKAPSLR